MAIAMAMTSSIDVQLHTHARTVATVATLTFASRLEIQSFPAHAEIPPFGMVRSDPADASASEHHPHGVRVRVCDEHPYGDGAYGGWGAVRLRGRERNVERKGGERLGPEGEMFSLVTTVLPRCTGVAGQFVFVAC